MATKPKILVTGAKGQLGKELKDLTESYPQFEFTFLSKADMPIQDTELVRNIFNTLKPQYCINCAGYTAVDKAEEEKEKAFQVNADGVGVLASFCSEHKTKLIHLSTDYVFNGNAQVPYTEESSTDPQTIYGLSKLEGEKKATAFNKNVIIIRTSWLYSFYGKNFVKTIIRLFREKNKISVVNDQLGSPTYAADLAEVILEIISKTHVDEKNWKQGIYHFSNEGIVSWYDLAVAIRDLLKSTAEIIPVTSDKYPSAAKRPAYSVMDNSKIQAKFNFRVKNWKSSLQVCLSKLE